MKMTPVELNANLFWSAREMFKFPDKQILTDYKYDLQAFLQWGANSRIIGAEEILNLLREGQLDWEEIQIDYTSLFINSFPQAKAHAFAGWYLGDKEYYGAQEAITREFYNNYGVILDENTNLPADHILVQTDFIAMMIEEYVDKGDIKYLEAISEFCNQHMKLWLEPFLYACELHAQTQYYRVIAAVFREMFNQLVIDLGEVA